MATVVDSGNEAGERAAAPDDRFWRLWFWPVVFVLVTVGTFAILGKARNALWTLPLDDAEEIAAEVHGITRRAWTFDLGFAAFYAFTAVWVARTIGVVLTRSQAMVRRGVSGPAGSTVAAPPTGVVAAQIQGLAPARRMARLGAVFVVAAALFDITENVLALRLADQRGLEAGAVAIAVLRAAAWSKLIVLVPGCALILFALISAIWRGRLIRKAVLRREMEAAFAASASAPTHGGPPPSPGSTPVWTPPWSRPDAPVEANTVGVCLSGGGIRSASFSLGALQALARSTVSPKYVTSVSGGGYMAAAWCAETNRRNDARKDAAPEARAVETPMFAPGSVEEGHVRNHTDYLVSSTSALAGAAFRIVGGLALNLVIVFLLVATLARPVGWVVGASHDSLGPRLPIVELTGDQDLELAAKPTVGTPAAVRFGTADVARLSTADVAQLKPCTGCPDGWEDAAIYLVAPGWKGEGDRGKTASGPAPVVTVTDSATCSPWEEKPAKGCEWGASTKAVTVAKVLPAVVADLGTKLIVIHQPSVVITEAAELAVTWTDPSSDAKSNEPRFGVCDVNAPGERPGKQAEAGCPPEDNADSSDTLEVTRQPRLRAVAVTARPFATTTTVDPKASTTSTSSTTTTTTPTSSTTAVASVEASGGGGTAAGEVSAAEGGSANITVTAGSATVTAGVGEAPEVQPAEAVAPTPGQAKRVVRSLELTRQPKVTQRSGTVGRDDLKIEGWMLIGPAILLALAGVAAMIDRPLLRHRLKSQHVVSKGLAAGSAIVFAILVAIPWMVSEVPAFVEQIPGYDSVATGWGALLGFLLAAGAAVWKFGGIGWKHTKWLRESRFGQALPDIVLGILAIVVLAAVTIYVIDVSAANGPTGLLATTYDSPYPGWTEMQRWLLGIVLLSLGFFVPAMAWSLQSFYRDRLSLAYLRPDERDTTKRLELDDMKIDLGSAGETCEWVVCTTANMRNVGIVAPGRQAGSFTFSKEWVGGPEVGWMPTDEYLRRLNEGRRRDLSVASLMAISGAAFSPAMGKDSKGWQGRMMAIANLRLGSWIANPSVVPAASLTGSELRKDLARSVERRMALAAQLAERISAWAQVWAVWGPVQDAQRLQATARAIREMFGPPQGAQPTPDAMSAGQHRRRLDRMLRELPAPIRPMIQAQADELRRMIGPATRKVRNARFGQLSPPGLPWFLREVFGLYDVSARYLYLTDGGHWDNLGLVELFRRKCTDIWMISAAGDGQQSFETFAQALALAREVAGIEIVSLDPDLEALRPPPKPDEAAKRKLRRKGMQVPTATAGFVTATFRYLGEDGKPLAMIGDDGQPDEDATCTLHIVEAALLGDLPWDLHAYAEANEDFPDISTGYQYMDHRDFEAYRMLGWVQAGRALQKAGELEDVELEGRTTPSAPPQVPTLPAHPIRVWRWWEQRHNEG